MRLKFSKARRPCGGLAEVDRKHVNGAQCATNIRSRTLDSARRTLLEVYPDDKSRLAFQRISRQRRRDDCAALSLGSSRYASSPSSGTSVKRYSDFESP